MTRLAYIIGTFPALNETFVAGEIQALRKRGIVPQLFALLKPKGFSQAWEGAELAAETTYSPALFSWQLWKANFQVLLSTPGRYLKTLAMVLVQTILNPVYCLQSLGIFPLAVAFAQTMRERQVEHVHAHWANYPATVAYVISCLLDIPFSFTAHNYDTTLVRALMREKVRNAVFIATCTDMTRRFLIALVPEAENKILLNHHGLFPSRFVPPVAREQSSRDRFQILSCGSLYPRKGFPDLLEACRLLRDRGLPFQCTIIGEGPLRLELEAFITKHQLEEHVRLLGALPQQEVIQYFWKTDLFVLACVTHYLGWKEIWMDPILFLTVGFAAPFRPLSDGIPNVLVEAMAAGVPVISTTTAGVPELLEDSWNGSLVPERDPQALASSIEQLLKDPRRRRKQALNGLETIQQQFDRGKNIEELINVFTSQPRAVSQLIPVLNTRGEQTEGAAADTGVRGAAG